MKKAVTKARLPIIPAFCDPAFCVSTFYVSMLRTSTIRLPFFLALLLVLLPASARSQSPYLVVKSVQGKVSHILPHGADKPLHPFVELSHKHQIRTGEEGQSVLRLFIANGQIKLNPNTHLKVSIKKHTELVAGSQAKGEKKTKPFLNLVTGSSEWNFSPEAGAIYPLETKNTLVLSKGARWFTSFHFDQGEVTKLIVLKGVIHVINHPKDQTADVPEGKTCYSDENGLRIVTSTAEDLKQFQQNLLEVDFVDPSSEQTKTLEVEYESNF